MYEENELVRGSHENKVIPLADGSDAGVTLTVLAIKKNDILNDVIVMQDGIVALDYLFGKDKYSRRDVNR